jgi:hypothetical protein
MSNTPAKIVLGFLLLAAPAASFAQMAGEAGAGNLAISGVPLGPANPGVLADPSGIGNASKMAPLPPPHISVPVVPKFE